MVTAAVTLYLAVTLYANRVCACTKTNPSTKPSHHDTKNNRHPRNSGVTNTFSPKRPSKNNELNGKKPGKNVKEQEVAEKLGTKHKTTAKLRETKARQNQPT